MRFDEEEDREPTDEELEAISKWGLGRISLCRYRYETLDGAVRYEFSRTIPSTEIAIELEMHTEQGSVLRQQRNYALVDISKVEDEDGESTIFADYEETLL